MSDNQKYYDVFLTASHQNNMFTWERDGVDAVIAAVREDMRAAFREEVQNLKPSEWREEGRQAAARDIRADETLMPMDMGQREHYARIAEHGPENVTPPR